MSTATEFGGDVKRTGLEHEGMSPLVESLVPNWFAPASLEPRGAENGNAGAGVRGWGQA